MTLPSITLTFDEARHLFRLANMANYRDHDEQRALLRLARYLDDVVEPMFGGYRADAIHEWDGLDDGHSDAMSYTESEQLSLAYLEEIAS